MVLADKEFLVLPHLQIQAMAVQEHGMLLVALGEAV